MPKKPREKFKYVDYEKSIFHHFCKAIIEAKKSFLEGEGPTLKEKKVIKRSAHDHL